MWSAQCSNLLTRSQPCIDWCTEFLCRIRREDWPMLSFSKEEFNHRKCRSTASSLSMPLLPISVHKGIAIASHFARGLCTPQPQCWWKEGFPCPNGRLRNIMVCQAWHERPRCHLWNCTLEMYNIENASCDRLHPSC